MAYTILDIIKKDLYAMNLRRINHIEGVAEAAESIRSRHFPNVSAEEAQLASYMHDFTKEYTTEQHFEIFEKYGVALNECEQSSSKLYHSISAWSLAKNVYRLSENVCSAIRYHTTGRANMNDLEKIIYLADFIEKNRTFMSCVDVRDTYNILTKRNHPTAVDSALLYSFDLTINELIEDKKLIHQDTVNARNYLIMKGIE